MPSYTFKCDDCEYELDLICSIKEYDEETASLCCPKCESQEFYRDYQADCVHGAVREVKTLGQLAERNEKKYGKEKCQLMRENFKTKKTDKPRRELPEGMSWAGSYENTPVMDRAEANKRIDEIKNDEHLTDEQKEGLIAATIEKEMEEVKRLNKIAVIEGLTFLGVVVAVVVAVKYGCCLYFLYKENI